MNKPVHILVLLASLLAFRSEELFLKNNGLETTATPAFNIEVKAAFVAALQVDFQQVASVYSGAGLEISTISGSILSAADVVPADDFTIGIYDDANLDGQVQVGEVLLGSILANGAVSPGTPLSFNGQINHQPAQACRLLAILSAANTTISPGVSVAVPLPVLLNAGSDLGFCQPVGPTVAATLGAANFTPSDYVFTWTSIAPAPLAALDNTGSGQPDFSLNWTAYSGQTLTYVLETQRIGCAVSTFDSVRIVIPVSANGWLEEEAYLIQSFDCNSSTLFCLNVNNSDTASLEVLVNDVPYTGSFFDCQNGLIGIQLYPGLYQIKASDATGTCTDSASVKVFCTETDHRNVSISLNEGDTICFGSDQLSGSIVSLTNACLDGSVANYVNFNDSCLIITADWLGEEDACFVACDANGFCDTTYLHVAVGHPFANGFRDTIAIYQIGAFCFDTSFLNLAGELVSMTNLCPHPVEVAQFEVNPTSFCAVYQGFEAGVDSACFEVCDNLGFCDTLQIDVVVVPGEVVYDTVFLQLDTHTYCLDTGLLTGFITSIENVCPDAGGSEVHFSINDNCVSYYGTAKGQDTICLRMIDHLGNMAIISVVVTVVKTTPAKHCNWVYVGQKKQFCLDTSELFAPYAGYSFFCPNETNGYAAFAFAPATFCVEYEGLETGKDSACVMICDEKGICDTTYFCITVIPYFDPPSANHDTVTTIRATPVVIDFLQNDTVFGGFAGAQILDPPISGTATLNPDYTFTYIPFEPFCARWDNFTYTVASENGLDTATVSIFIECIGLTIFSAVSPNNDGYNDVFYIAKIEDFPENRLWVYNRWGHLVYETNAYRNNWPGTFGNDTDLPDGSYYYILEWTDNGATTIQRGYLEMFR